MYSTSPIEYNDDFSFSSTQEITLKMRFLVLTSQNKKKTNISHEKGERDEENDICLCMFDRCVQSIILPVSWSLWKTKRFPSYSHRSNDANNRLSSNQQRKRMTIFDRICFVFFLFVVVTNIFPFYIHTSTYKHTRAHLHSPLWSVIEWKEPLIWF